MKLLLDTHTLVWWLEGDPHLPVKIRMSAENAENVVVNCYRILKVTAPPAHLRIELEFVTT